MAMTEQEQFEFDLNGFMIRPAILTSEQIAAVTEQVRLIVEDPEALPPEHRAACSGPSELLIDHPKVVDVLHEAIGSDLRLEGSFPVYRHRGEGEQAFHHGGEGNQADPLFGYRVGLGRMFAGSIRVVFELTDIDERDGATAFVPGSHKLNFPKTPDWYGTPREGNVSHLARGYSCPAGSAVFFTEALAHAGTRWARDTPRIAIFNLYSHVAINFHRWIVPPAVMAGLPRERQAWYRPVWFGDFTTRPGAMITNTHETWTGGNEAPIAYSEAVPTV